MAITTRTLAMQSMAQGKGYFRPITSVVGTAGTAGAAGSGFFSVQLRPNSIGTTLPSTLQGYAAPTCSEEMYSVFSSYALSSTSATVGNHLAIAYKIGTLNLAATGDRFTHDAATFPILRTKFGAASQAINLIPIVVITTATATTAPVFRLRTAGGAAGYVNQSGTSVIGTKTMTMPAAATAAASGYIFRLEEGDVGVEDITNIEVTTAGTAGAAEVWGVEILAAHPIVVSAVTAGQDQMFGGFSMANIKPGVATSGSVTSVLCHFMHSTTASTGTVAICGVRN